LVAKTTTGSSALKKGWYPDLPVRAARTMVDSGLAEGAAGEMGPFAASMTTWEVSGDGEGRVVEANSRVMCVLRIAVAVVGARESPPSEGGSESRSSAMTASMFSRDAERIVVECSQNSLALRPCTGG
jgi:hypothetical protein